MVKLLDCTTRDGGYCTNWNYSNEYIFNLMSCLNENNVCYYEIGYRNYYDRKNKGKFYYCTPNVIKHFYDQKGALNLGVMVDTKRYNESDFVNANDDCLDFVRIATHPDRITDTLLIAESLKNKNYSIMIQLMDITNLTEEHYNILEEWENKTILHTLYLADTYGIIKPENIETYYKILQRIGFKNISFHAHNKTNCALSNSLKVIELGGYSIDITQDGIGINGGNLSCKDIYEYTN